MRMRTLSFLLALVMVMGVFTTLVPVSVSAADGGTGKLRITSHSDDDVVYGNEDVTITWKSVSGACYYHLTIKDTITGEKLFDDDVYGTSMTIEANTAFLVKGRTYKIYACAMDANGKVSMVQADTAAMNYLSAQLIAGAQEQLRSADAQTLEVPLGSLLGGQILSQTGPNIVLKVKPIGSVKMDFETTFEQMGINQVRYQVSLMVESDARLLVPFSGEKISVSYRLPISETVIVGDVPDTYVFVPENEILDAI